MQDERLKYASGNYYQEGQQQNWDANNQNYYYIEKQNSAVKSGGGSAQGSSFAGNRPSTEFNYGG